MLIPVLRAASSHYSIITGSDENEIGTGPQRRGNCAPWARCQNYVVIIGDLKFLDHRWQRLCFDNGKIGQKLIRIHASVSLCNEGDISSFRGEVPTQGCR